MEDPPCVDVLASEDDGFHHCVCHVCSGGNSVVKVPVGVGDGMRASSWDGLRVSNQNAMDCTQH